MPSLLSRLRGANSQSDRSDWFSDHFLFNGQQVGALTPRLTMPGSPAENVGDTFDDMVHYVRDRNGVVSGAVACRALLVSQMRFAWRNEVSGDLYGDGSLSILERPGTDTRPMMLYRAEEDASYAGNSYIWRNDGKLYRLRPDWVDIIIGSNDSPDEVASGADAEVVGYLYYPGGRRGAKQAKTLTTAEVCHFAPEPHPLRRFVGASWVTSLLRDIIADGQATQHIQNYFEHAATANMVVTAPEGAGQTEFGEWVDMFESAHAGVSKAWSNIYVAHGTDVNVVGSNLAQLDLKQLTGAFEARITMRSRVPGPILGTREGMEGSALNGGNYAQLRRLWADNWFTPYADMWCAAFESIVPPPNPSSELTYRRDRILFLQEDMADTANIQATKSQAMRQLIDAGYEPDSVRDAIITDDMSKLRHTGLAPVQVQPVSTMPQGDADGAD